MSSHLPLNELLMGMWGALLLFGWPFLWIIAYYWYRDRQSRREAELIADMVARGFTPREVVFVLSKGRGAVESLATKLPPEKLPARMSAI